MDYYYYDGEKRLGPVNSAQLVALARSGGISGETIVESGGKRCRADKVPGLIPPRSESPFVVPPVDPQPVEPPPADPPPVQDSTAPAGPPPIPEFFQKETLYPLKFSGTQSAVNCVSVLLSLVFFFFLFAAFSPNREEGEKITWYLDSGFLFLIAGILIAVICDLFRSVIAELVRIAQILSDIRDQRR